MLATLKLPLYIRVGKTDKSKKYSLSYNQMRNYHFHVKNNLKVVFNEIVCKQLPSEWQSPVAQIKIIYTLFPRARNCDLMNYCSIVDKFLQDTLVGQKLITDDTVEYVPAIDCRYGEPCFKDPHIIVQIEELK